MDKRVIGYVVALVGLAILIFGAGGFNIPLLSSLPKVLVSGAGMVLVGLGVVVVVMFGGGGRKSKGYEGKKKNKAGGKIKDLPIYEGDNIVAYRRD